MSLDYPLDKNLDFELKDSLDSVQRFAAEAGFLPTDLSGLLAWYDAQYTDSITLVGGYVSQWDDRSGNDYHATQGIAAYRFEYLTNHAPANGYNALRSDASESTSTADSMDTPDIGLCRKVYVVAAYEDGTQSNVLTFGRLFRNKTDINVTVALSSFNEAFFFTSSRVEELKINGFEYGSDAYQVPLPLSVIEVTFISPGYSDGFYLGGYGSSSSWHGPLGEFIFTDGTESAEEATQLRDYLYNKWGITPPA